jgi:hypothetical protein
MATIIRHQTSTMFNVIFICLFFIFYSEIKIIYSDLLDCLIIDLFT